MNCDELTRRLWAYFEDQLPAAERAEVDRHASECASCGALLVQCGELTCREFVGFLNDYVEEQLSQKRRRIFERHLQVCRDCRSYLDGYRKTIALGKASAPDLDDMPPDLLRAVIDAWS